MFTFPFRSFKESAVTGNASTLPRQKVPEKVAEIITIKPKVITPNRTMANTQTISPKDIEDLIHLQGPLTEDAVMRTLQARYDSKKYFVSKDDLFN